MTKIPEIKVTITDPASVTSEAPSSPDSLPSPYPLTEESEPSATTPLLTSATSNRHLQFQTSVNCDPSEKLHNYAATSTGNGHLISFDDDDQLHIANGFGLPLDERVSSIRVDKADHGNMKLGTFKGVLVPTCEFAWSVLIFIRFGYIVGEAGVLCSIAITFISALTVAITVASISAIATNGVPTGGVLHILTKSLGTGIGGAISLIYCIGVAIFISVEVVGSVQGLIEATDLSITDDTLWDQVIISSGCLLFIGASAFIGKSIVHRLAMFFLLALILAFLAVFLGLFTAPRFNHHNFNHQVTGLSIETLRSNLYPHSSFSFKDAISLLLPCFVGIFSGTNNAMNLKHPFKSIPTGAFGAVATSTTLYVTLFLLIGSVVKRELLLSNVMIIPEIAFPSPWIAIIGLFLVGQGSALHCCALASKVLNTLSVTRILPHVPYIPIHHLKNGEPRFAVIVTILFTVPFIFITELEALASIVSMTFILCYGFTNFATFLLGIFPNPSWRPTYKYYHWLLSLMGLIGCLVIMFVINWGAGLLILVITAVVTLLIQLYGHRNSWGHAVHGLLYSLAMHHLLAVQDAELQLAMRKFQIDLPRTETLDIVYGYRQDSTNSTVSTPEKGAEIVWRPHILAFVSLRPDGQLRYRRLLSFISQLSVRGGLCILSHIVTTSEESRTASNVRKALSELPDVSLSLDSRNVVADVVMRRSVRLQLAMKEENVDGFVKVFSSPSVRIGQQILLQTAGLGELSPNSVVCGWPDKSSWEENVKSVRELRDLWKMAKRGGLSTFICKGLQNFPTNEDELSGTIDIWWIINDGPLILLLAFILRQHQVWKNCSVRLFASAHVTDNVVEMELELRKYLALLRIEVDEIIIITLDMSDILDVVPLQSKPSPEGRSSSPKSCSSRSASLSRGQAFKFGLMADRLAREMHHEEAGIDNDTTDEEITTTSGDSDEEEGIGPAEERGRKRTRASTADNIAGGSVRKNETLKRQNSWIESVEKDLQKHHQHQHHLEKTDLPSQNYGGMNDDTAGSSLPSELDTAGLPGLTVQGHTPVSSVLHPSNPEFVNAHGAFSEVEIEDTETSNSQAHRHHHYMFPHHKKRPITSHFHSPRFRNANAKQKLTELADVAEDSTGNSQHIGYIPPFFKAKTAIQLRTEMNHHSRNSDLVILNLPSPDLDVNIFGLAGVRRVGVYMELLEFLTSDIERSVLVHSGGKAKDLMSWYSL
ncbi:amino acid permease-domain-containing protein [Paraphysoderma sedebokerense]|nr:amino acid permease-domain-containing protein [Paraphysoderma sedebokerense]